MTDSSIERQKQVEELVDKGFAYLREREFVSALGIADELEELQFTAAFDIGAQAQVGLGNLSAALDLLERGLVLAPDCWRNWQLLGNYRSDNGEYREAIAAYDRALQCTDVSADSVYLNKGILASRCGDHAHALENFEKAIDPELRLPVASAKLEVLREMGRFDEALVLAEECLAEPRQEGDLSELLGGIAASRGRAQLELGVGPKGIRQASIEAIDEFGCHAELLDLVKDIDGAKVLYFLMDAIPVDDHPEIDELGGAFINCWMTAGDERRDHEELVRSSVAEDGWRVTRTIEFYEVNPALYRAEDPGQRRYLEALQQGMSLAYHTFERKHSRAIDDDFYRGKRTRGIPLVFNDLVEIVSGDLSGKFGTVVSVETVEPELEFVVQVNEDGEDVVFAVGQIKRR